MIKTLIAGAALGYIGKKLYDEGKLDPYIDSARTKLREAVPQGQSNGDRMAPGLNPDVATAPGA